MRFSRGMQAGTRGRASAGNRSDAPMRARRLRAHRPTEQQRALFAAASRLGTMETAFQSLFTAPDQDQDFRSKIRDLFESEAPVWEPLQQQLEALRRGRQRRLIVSLDLLRREEPTIAKLLFENPLRFLPIFEEVLTDYIAQWNTALAAAGAAGRERQRLHVGFEGAFGALHTTPRSLRASMLNSMVCVDGIITRVSAVRPKVVESVHFIPAKNEIVHRVYRDGISLDVAQNRGLGAAIYPTRDEDGNPMETEFGLSAYRDFQTATLQEMPERTPPGQLPRTVDIVFEADLVDVCKPGMRVRIIGTYRALGGKTTTYFATKIVANHCIPLSDTQHRLKFSERDLANIREVASTPGGIELLTASIAPSICGHYFIKKAVLLQLVGGAEKNLSNGTHLRGDINILLVGDPSTAKSQMLRFVLHVAPSAISTTGRGSSGVGLTAAVTTDPDTGERHLEAGAMVLADRGVVCIDEFDKMSDADRVAIHEVMEQQTVTIAKAGIHTTLNARCSVLAAANPIYGSYDRRRKPAENIALPDSLLSRFDLVFIVLDTISRERDELIARHVLRVHQYRNPDRAGRAELAGYAGADVDTPLDERATPEHNAPPAEATTVESTDDQGFESDAAAAAAAARASDDPMTAPLFVSHQANEAIQGAAAHRILSVPFLQKYIHYARELSPQLTEEAAAYIASRYRDLRAKDDARTLPITARQLETMIRLATAHAKLRLSLTVDITDARAAFDLLNFALYHETQIDREHDVARAAPVRSPDANTSPVSASAAAPLPQRSGTRRRTAPASRRLDPFAFDDDDDNNGDGDDGDESEAASNASASDEPSYSPGRRQAASRSTRASQQRIRRRVRSGAALDSSVTPQASDIAAHSTLSPQAGGISSGPETRPVTENLAALRVTGERVTPPNQQADAMTVPLVDDALLERVQQAIEAITSAERSESTSFDQLVEQLADPTIEREQVERALQALEAMGLIMYRSNLIFRI
jgi:DNA replication licensing factor MCM3